MTVKCCKLVPRDSFSSRRKKLRAAGRERDPGNEVVIVVILQRTDCVLYVKFINTNFHGRHTLLQHSKRVHQVEAEIRNFSSSVEEIFPE